MMMIAVLMIAAQAAAPPPPPAPSIQGPVRINTDAPLIGEDDYPEQAMFDDAEGVTAFVLTIGTNGRATGCDVTASSGHAQLDIRACALVRQRARFTPARQASRAVESQWRSRVRWVLPNNGHVMVDPRVAGRAKTPPAPRPEFKDIDPRIAAWGAGVRGPASGRSFVLLDIDTAGVVTRCVPDGSTADAARSALACGLFKGNKLFVPGFDTESNAIPDRVRVKIGW